MRTIRMRTIRKPFLFLLVTLLFLSAACSNGAESLAPTADVDEIAATVAAQLQSPPPDAATRTLVSEETTATTAAAAPAGQSAALAQGGVGLQDTLVDLYRRANPAVAYIIVPPLTSGSGFVYSEEGYIVTNNHVVEDGSTFEVVFANDERREAELVGTDVDSDLAVLKVDDLPQGIEPLPLADADSLQVGHFAVAIGNPFGEQGSMSLGIVSALGRSLPSQRGLGTGSRYSLPEVIQTDAPINPGNSGGPLLNLQGQVIGVTSAIASNTGTNSGVGYSIPVQAVGKIVPELIAEGRYVYPYMGAGFDEEISLEELDTFGLSQTQGAYVLSVTPGSPADEAGLVAADPTTGRGGDLLVAIDDRPVNDFADLNSYLVFHTSVGQTVQLTVLRDGQEVTLPLTLAARP